MKARGSPGIRPCSKPHHTIRRGHARLEVQSLPTGPAVFDGGDFSPVTAERPAQAGERFVMSVSGLGPVWTSPGCTGDAAARGSSQLRHPEVARASFHAEQHPVAAHGIPELPELNIEHGPPRAVGVEYRTWASRRPLRASIEPLRPSAPAGPEPRFMNQCRGVESVPRASAGQVMPGQTAQWIP